MWSWEGNGTPGWGCWIKTHLLAACLGICSSCCQERNVFSLKAPRDEHQLPNNKHNKAAQRSVTDESSHFSSVSHFPQLPKNIQNGVVGADERNESWFLQISNKSYEMGFFFPKQQTQVWQKSLSFPINAPNTSRLLLPAAQRGAGDAPRLRFVSSFILQVGRQAQWNKQEAALCFSPGAFFITAAVSSTAAILSISQATPGGERECSDGGWKVQPVYLLT